MYKKSMLLLFIITILIPTLCSCGGFGMGRFFTDSDDKIAEKRVEQLVEAINNEDRESLKLMFSEQALAESNNFEEQIDYLFEFIQGEIQTWESNYPTASEHNRYGSVTKKFTWTNRIDTDKQKYIFCFIDYVEDTDHPENVGLYTFRVVKAEDVNSLGNWKEVDIPGIY